MARLSIKPRLSIELIGRIRFYMGVSVGVAFSILFYAFFTYFKEIFRLSVFNSEAEPFILTPSETFSCNLFFGGISVTAGLGFTVWTWFHAMTIRHGLPRRRLNYISAYAIFCGMGLLYVVAKGSTTFALFLGNLDAFRYLNLTETFPELLILMPSVAFLNIWMPIRLVFRSGTWMALSFVSWLAFSSLLALAYPYDPSVVDKYAERELAPYIRIVDEELGRARAKGLVFSEEAIDAMRYNTHWKSIDQMKALKARFRSNTPVPTDSVVIELVIVKKTAVRMLPGGWSLGEYGSWPFALPRDIFRQLEINPDPIVRPYLEEIVAEFDSIFNGVPSDEMANGPFWRKFENRERMRYNFPSISTEFEFYHAGAPPPKSRPKKP